MTLYSSINSDILECFSNYSTIENLGEDVIMMMENNIPPNATFVAEENLDSLISNTETTAATSPTQPLVMPEDATVEIPDMTQLVQPSVVTTDEEVNIVISPESELLPEEAAIAAEDAVAEEAAITAEDAVAGEAAAIAEEEAAAIAEEEAAAIAAEEAAAIAAEEAAAIAEEAAEEAAVAEEAEEDAAAEEAAVVTEEETKGGGLLENIIILMVGLALYLILTKPEVKIDNIVSLIKSNKNIIVIITIILIVTLCVKSCS